VGALLSDPRASYDVLAPYYERFTDGYRHDKWLPQLDALCRDHGLTGTHVLDVACGTGRSLRPLLSMGYSAVGCDVSSAMLAEAELRAPGVPFHLADMRSLPPLGRFDWITCLNDAVNYLMSRADLERALRSMRRLLKPDGLLVFDVNTLREHRDGFASTFVVQDESVFLCWEGRGCTDADGYPGHADIAIFGRAGDLWQRALSRHTQRWWSSADVARSAAAAGLEVIAVRGQLPGASIQRSASEERHAKFVYVLAPRREPGDHGEVSA
jgi:SAM-dependent methyltransferase